MHITAKISGIVAICLCVVSGNESIIHDIYHSENMKQLYLSLSKYRKLIKFIESDKITANELEQLIANDPEMHTLINSDVLKFPEIKDTPKHPVQLAVNLAKANKLKILLNHRTKDINTIKCLGSGRLTKSAIDAGALDILTILLDKGAAVNCCDYLNGFTCLMYAVHKNDAYAVLLLLNRGVDVNFLSVDVNPEVNRIFSALDVAKWKRNQDLYNLLVKYGAKQSTNLEK